MVAHPPPDRWLNHLRIRGSAAPEYSVNVSISLYSNILPCTILVVSIFNFGRRIQLAYSKIIIKFCHPKLELPFPAFILKLFNHDTSGFIVQDPIVLILIVELSPPPTLDSKFIRLTVNSSVRTIRD